MEFEKKKTEWEKIRPLVIQLNNAVPAYLKEDSSLPGTPKNIISNITLNEENLSADFKKKLDEWRTKKSQQSIRESSKKQQHQQQPDWQLWKTGQMKFENQGLIALPDAKDLPEDFQKKLSKSKIEFNICAATFTKVIIFRRVETDEERRSSAELFAPDIDARTNETTILQKRLKVAIDVDEEVKIERRQVWGPLET